MFRQLHTFNVELRQSTIQKELIRQFLPPSVTGAHNKTTVNHRYSYHVTDYCSNNNITNKHDHISDHYEIHNLDNLYNFHETDNLNHFNNFNNFNNFNDLHDLHDFDNNNDKYFNQWCILHRKRTN